ncbi:purine-cytosine permease family protein [Enteractinococcus helveticum]|uniref:purine-cytosine permease family protein n=1 Tax=Enteractinococcus helveticum TaxID=1837282 RepID=UPI0005BDA6E0|nr:cytosine permease [Enteractinococcus helveticum]
MSYEPPVVTKSFVRFEKQHIMPIPENARTGTTWSVFAIWMGLNMMPLAAVTGAVATGTYNLPIGWSIVAILAGNVIGAFGSALHASQGPHLGIPQMLQARGQFGFYGGALFALIALIMFIGFFASILVVAKDALVLVLPSIDGTVAIVGFAAIGIILCIFGYDLLRKTMIYLSWIIGISVAVSMALLWFRPEVLENSAQATFSVEAFFAVMAIGVVWQLAYAPYVSDYTRYLPKATGPKTAFWSTYIGLVASSVFVMILGVLLGTVAPTNPLEGLSSYLGLIGFAVLIIFALTSAIINGIELYSAVMNGLTVMHSSFRKLTITTNTRVATTLVLGVVSTIIAVLGQGNFMFWFESFLNLLLYALIPWSAINLADYFIVKKGDYEVADLFRRDGGRYGKWNAVGLVSYFIGLASQIPFMMSPFFDGPLAASLNYIDISWLIGFIFTGVVFLVLQRFFAKPDPVNTGSDVQVLQAADKTLKS